jgi:hypothetical protein
VIDIASVVDAEGGILVEEYEDIKAHEWEPVVALASAQGKRFHQRELELRKELNLPRPPPEDRAGAGWNPELRSAERCRPGATGPVRTMTPVELAA